MQDYASRLNRSLPGADTGTASSTLGIGTATALMGPYATSLPYAGQQPGDNGGGGFGLTLADNAPVTDEQRAIIDMMMASFSSAPRVR